MRPLGRLQQKTISRDRPEHPTRLRRVFKFGLVGVSGLVVNTLALTLATEALGIHYLASVALATQVSTVWNYVLIDTLVFRGHRTTHGRSQRFASYWSLNMAAMLARYPLIWLLTSVLGVHYIISNLTSLILLFTVRFVVSDVWIWSSAPPRAGLDSPRSLAEKPVAEQG